MERGGVVSLYSAMLAYSGYPATKQYYDRYIGWAAARSMAPPCLSGEPCEGGGSGRLGAHALDQGRTPKVDHRWFQLEHRQLGMPFENVIVFSPEMREMDLCRPRR